MTDDLDDLALPEGTSFPLDDAPGPARRITPAAASAMIDAAIAAAAAPPIASPPHARLAWTIAGVSSAIAAISLGAIVWILARAPEPTTPSVAPAIAPPPPIAPAEEPPPAPEERAVAETDDPVVARDAPARTPRRDRAPAVPEDLLAEANALRGAGAWREAESAYARVSRTSPGTLSAYVADVAAADVRREHLSDPRGAARLYRRAISARPTGPLDREAREGLALALRAAGDAAGERAALEDLLARHPSERTRARLAELAAQSTP